MPKGLKFHSSAHTEHTQLPCGRQFNGAGKQVQKLVKMHKKLCVICLKTINEDMFIGISHTDARLNSQFDINKTVVDKIYNI